MPVPEVEAGLPSAATVDLLTLAAVDEGQSWAFPTLRAWTNVAGRRGYLLDGFADWLAARGAAEGDSLSFYRDSDASPPVSCSSCAAVGLAGTDCSALLLSGSGGLLFCLLPAWHEREAVAATAGQAAAAPGSAPSTCCTATTHALLTQPGPFFALCSVWRCAQPAPQRPATLRPPSSRPPPGPPCRCCCFPRRPSCRQHMAAPTAAAWCP